jgi:tetracycline repressor-like protein
MASATRFGRYARVAIRQALPLRLCCSCWRFTWHFSCATSRAPEILSAQDLAPVERGSAAITLMVQSDTLLFGLAAETREQHERGCLLLSANLQRDTRDAVIADFLRDNQNRVEAIFVEALRRAQTRGELSRTHKPAALTHFFVVTIQGMRTTARLTSDRKALEQVARIALAVFS